VTDDEVDLVARRVAALLGRADRSPALLTAAEVATRFGVERAWVYAHAHELGVIRLGDGPRPRLRFDPAVVEQLLNPPPPGAAPTTALLPIRTSRPRRSRRRVGDEERRPRR
jgi:hypothetical protein